jgi:hypothetical protein
MNIKQINQTNNNYKTSEVNTSRSSVSFVIDRKTLRKR